MPDTPIAETMSAVDAWMRAHRAAYYAQWLPGISETDLAAQQRRLPWALPDDVQGWYRWKNGQNSKCFESFAAEMALSALNDMVSLKLSLDGMIGKDFEEPDWWKTTWMPFMENGCGDCLFLDMSLTPAPVLVFYHDDARREVLAASLGQWLALEYQRMRAAPA